MRALAVEVDAREAHRGGWDTVDAFTPDSEPDVALLAVCEREGCLHEVEGFDDWQTEGREEEDWTWMRRVSLLSESSDARSESE